HTTLFRSFAFVDDLKTRLDDPWRRVVIFGDSEFTHYRARYFALPQPVISRERVSKRWLRRLRSNDVLALVHLDEALKERPVRVQSAPQRATRTLDLAAVAGRHAELAPCSELAVEGPCDQGFLRLREGEKPWLVELPYTRQLASGIWR